MSNVLKKITYAFVTIYLAITAIFFVIRMAPGDPIERILGPEATISEIEKYKKDLGLDKSTYEQYFHYMNGLIRMDLGNSLYKKKAVKNLIQEFIPPTLTMALGAIILAILWGIPTGVLSAVHKTTKIDNILRIITLLSLSFPIFSLAPILVLFFSIKLGWFPVSEWGTWKHMFLPIITLGIPLGSILSRITRNKFLEENEVPWIQVLFAKGMKKYSVTLRILKVVLPTIMNVIAIQLSVVLAGTMVTETIFDIPGMGLLLFEGIQNRDYPVVQGIIIYSTVIYMLVYFIIDFINMKIDPRIEN